MNQSAKEWTAEENLKQASALKDLGNKFFVQKNYKEAFRHYHKAILHLAGIISQNSSVSAYSKDVASAAVAGESDDLKYSIYLNMSQIYIFDDKIEKALYVLNKAHSLKQNAKLYYRRGICNMRLSNFERAREDYQKVVDLDPSMKAQIDKLTKQLKELEKKQDEKSKNMFQKFFK